jgi:hypothetical protein
MEDYKRIAEKHMGAAALVVTKRGWERGVQIGGGTGRWPPLLSGGQKFRTIVKRLVSV